MVPVYEEDTVAALKNRACEVLLSPPRTEDGSSSTGETTTYDAVLMAGGAAPLDDDLCLAQSGLATGDTVALEIRRRPTKRERRASRKLATELRTLTPTSRRLQRCALLKAAEATPDNTAILSLLAACGEPTLELEEGLAPTRTPHQLCVRCFAITQSKDAFLNLALTLQDGETTTLEDGTHFSNREEILTALVASHPRYEKGWFALAGAVDKGGSCTLRNGTTMTKAQLYYRAGEVGGSARGFYRASRSFPAAARALTVYSETGARSVVTRVELYRKVLELEPTHTRARQKLEAYEASHPKK